MDNEIKLVFILVIISNYIRVCIYIYLSHIHLNYFVYILVYREIRLLSELFPNSLPKFTKTFVLNQTEFDLRKLL